MTNYERYRKTFDGMMRKHAYCDDIAKFIGFYCVENDNCAECLCRVMAWASEEYKVNIPRSMNKEQFLEYIKRHFTLDETSQKLIPSFVEYICNQSGDNVTKWNALDSVLSSIGMSPEEVRQLRFEEEEERFKFNFKRATECEPKDCED